MTRNSTQRVSGTERPAGSRPPIINALTVDVEDWVQSVLDPDAPLSNRFVANTHRILELLDGHGVRATFFVLGLAARKAPQLVRAIQSAGHEVQSHGYGHRLLHTLNREEVVNDLVRSRKLLEDITGTAVTAYRAPAFSITRANPWVLDALRSCGYTTDASIVPARTKRYGIAGAPWYPHKLRTPGGETIVEVPVATASFLGRRVPMGGGGYLRLYPVQLVAHAIRTINRSGQPATIYMHPYEFNPDELAALPRAIPPALRIHQGLGRRAFGRKMERLLSTIRFGSLRDALSTAALPTHDPHWTTRSMDRAFVEKPTALSRRRAKPSPAKVSGKAPNTTTLLS